jgi:tRNA (adenine37-N6)-methyltransferase
MFAEAAARTGRPPGAGGYRGAVADGGPGQRIVYRPIGVVRSPHARLEGTPLQTTAAEGIAGTVEVEEEFAGGLADLDGFSHLLLLVHLHASNGWTPQVVPFLDDVPRGVFATRSPRRPNPIGLSLVRLDRIAGATLHVRDLDLLDGTPVLDIKPHVPRFDHRDTDRIGWFAGRLGRLPETRSDARFASPGRDD